MNNTYMLMIWYVSHIWYVMGSPDMDGWISWVSRSIIKVHLGNNSDIS